MAISKKWFNTVRRKFHRSSHTTTLLPDTKTSPTSSSEQTASFEEDIAVLPTPSSSLKKDSTKIQAFFRGYLARPANKRLGKSQSCFRIVRRKSRKPSHTNINRAGSSIEETNARKETTYSEDPTVAASSSQKTDITREDMAEARQTFRAGDSISTSSKKKRKRTSRNCFNIVFRRRSSRRDILSPDGNIPSNSTEEAVAKEEINETAASTTSSARNEEATKETINFVSEASSTLSSEKKDLTIEDIAAIKIQASFRGHLVRRQTFRARETIATSSKKKRKGMPQNCFSIGQRRFRRRSPKASRINSTEEAIVKEDTIKVQDGNGAPSSQKEELTKEDVAAVKIQAIFRGHSVLHPNLCSI